LTQYWAKGKNIFKTKIKVDFLLIDIIYKLIVYLPHEISKK